jgi:hypothetical protein
MLVLVELLAGLEKDWVKTEWDWSTEELGLELFDWLMAESWKEKLPVLETRAHLNIQLAECQCPRMACAMKL